MPLALEKRFSERELELIFSNIKAIQLTYGCSMGCAFCGFDAIKKAREHIPYSQLVNMFQEYGEQLAIGKPFLYWASEPSDYASKEGLEDRTYKDVHELAVRYGRYDPSITSFNLKDQEWIDFMAQRTSDYGRPNRRLSVFGMNESQLGQLRSRVASSERNTYTESRGSSRIRFTGQTGRSKTIRHVKGMGKSLDESDIQDDTLKSGIACVDGILLTPRGLYNLFVVPISKEFPQGVIIVPLERISDESVKEGDNLKEVMRRAVVHGVYSHQGALFHANPGQSDHYEDFQRYTGEFPKKVILYNKHIRYRAVVDRDGNILRIDATDRLYS